MPKLNTIVPRLVMYSTWKIWNQYTPTWKIGKFVSTTWRIGKPKSGWLLAPFLRKDELAILENWKTLLLKVPLEGPWVSFFLAHLKNLKGEKWLTTSPFLGGGKHFLY